MSTAPEEDLKPIVSYYWTLGMNDKSIAIHQSAHRYSTNPDGSKAMSFSHMD
jgi:hypothetical protein